MKKIILLLSLFIQLSCTKEQKEVSIKQIENKYQMEILEIDEDNFYSIILDKTNGKVFIGLNSSNWYEATHEIPLTKSNDSRYTIKVKKTKTPNGNVPQIFLFDQVSAETYVYVVNNVANFYSVVSPFDSI
ncbi:hypothetical protein [Flavobacterium sp. HNIBRBA15423]|uniref:hypothetical protein n=1 Tax=Flavobacterium sp. HNIBRBA15423 TaxID=3458683 RepID=UPI00404495D3